MNNIIYKKDKKIEKPVIYASGVDAEILKEQYGDSIIIKEIKECSEKRCIGRDTNSFYLEYLNKYLIN